MIKTLLVGIAALCSFVAAGLNYYYGRMDWITGLQVLAGVLMVISAIRMNTGTNR